MFWIEDFTRIKFRNFISVGLFLAKSLQAFDNGVMYRIFRLLRLDGTGKAWALLLFASVTLAATPNKLNLKAIQQSYSDGDFEIITRQLEEFRIKNSPSARGDSLIIAKFLGVIYASNPATREKGKYWLYKLLQSDPNAELVDLYVSEEIQSVFDRVHRELVTRRNYQGINDVGLNNKMAADKSNSAKVHDTVILKDTVTVNTNSVPDALIGIATSLQTPAPAFAGKESENTLGWTFNLNALAGQKFMDESNWDPVQDQFAVGGSFDFRRVSWPINLTISFIYTSSEDLQRIADDGSDYILKSNTQELFFGVRKVWNIRLISMRPFCGGGIGLIASELDNSKFNTPFKKTGKGGWLDGGVYYELERHFNFGMESWYSWAKVDFVTGSANAGGYGFGIVAGYHY